MDSEVVGSRGKRRRLWVVGGVGAVLVVGVLAGLVANGSRSGSASDIITFECSGQTFWFNKTEKKRYGDIDNKKDKLAEAVFLKTKCPMGQSFSGSREFLDFLTEQDGDFTSKKFWMLDGDGKTCKITPSAINDKTFFLDSCDVTSKTDEWYVLRKD